ncbi:MAG: hypothetical protein ACU84Q_03660 [Gammaproteobacteria bacterium]
MLLLMVTGTVPGFALENGADANSDGNTSGAEALEQVLIHTGLPIWVLQLEGEVTLEAAAIEHEDKMYRNLKLPIAIDEQQITVREAQFFQDDGLLTFNFEFDRLTNRFLATVSGQQLNLSLFGETESNSEPGTFYFDSELLFPKWVETLTGTLKADIQRSKIDGMTYAALSVAINLNPGTLRTSFEGKIRDAQFEGELDHSYSSNKTTLRLTGNNFDLSLFPASQEYVERIPMDFRADLSGNGNSMRQLAATMDGNMLVELGSGNLNIKKLNSLSQDILSLTLASLSPISLSSKHSTLECGALKLDITNGIAVSDNSIALRTDTLAIVGGGEVNFRDESLALALVPHARNGGKLTTKTAINKITVNGPFGDLSVKPHLAGIINQGISLTSKIASFGVSKFRVPVLDWASPADIACMKSLALKRDSD